MKLDALDHPKTLDFAARLQVELPTAIGYLELLWAFTGKKSPQGNIGKWPDGAIARACYFMGQPTAFMKALVDARFLDLHPEHRYLIHDWHEHAPRWVKSKLKALGLDFLPPVSADTHPGAVDDTPGDTSLPTKGRVVKGREGKRSEEKGAHSRDDSQPASEGEIPPGLNRAAWHRWYDYRVEIRKPLKQASIPAAQKALAAFGSDQVAVVEQSIANGWQGLFALKNKSAPARAGGRRTLADYQSDLRTTDADDALPGTAKRVV